MRIGGLQKTSMIDFPGTVSAVIFTIGCNFTCPYCHNHQLVVTSARERALPAPEEIDNFLQKRRNVLGGIVISGGEPTLQGDALLKFCTHLKSQGYKVKLDTNGSNPEMLRELFRLRLLDYVAIDIKADPCSYPMDICSKESSGGIQKSIEILAANDIAHEFRIPCVHPFITKDSFASILNAANKRVEIFLQAVSLKSVLKPSFFAPNGTGRPLNIQEMETLRIRARTAGLTCHIR